MTARLDAARSDARARLGYRWWAATSALAEAPEGLLPSFASTDAYKDLRLDSAIVAVAQGLVATAPAAGVPYDHGGCVIPDAYVEAAPQVFASLAEGLEQSAAAVRRFDPMDEEGAQRTFARMARKLRTLAAIAAGELTGRPLTEVERRWLSSVVEMSAASTTAPPSYDGWYFDLFSTPTEALARADVLAELGASKDGKAERYLGARPPRLAVFVIDTGGPPRVVIGPVAHGIEVSGKSEMEPWAQSYAVPGGPVPSLRVEHDGDKLTVTAPERLGVVTVELCDHHRRPVETITRILEAGSTEIATRTPAEHGPPEVLHVRVGSYDRWVEVASWGTWLDTTKTD